MVGGIPAGTLENNPRRGVDLAQAVFVALRATFEWFVMEGLVAIELYSATFTAIRINWHTTSLSERNVIIASFECHGKMKNLCVWDFHETAMACWLPTSL